jgi:hypothetical protein
MSKAPYFECIVCGHYCEPLSGPGDDRYAPPDDGVCFQAYGNYGTTLFDPSPGAPEKCLEIVVCDWCLIEQAQRVRVFMKDDTVGLFEDQIKKCVGPGPKRTNQA